MNKAKRAILIFGIGSMLIIMALLIVLKFGTSSNEIIFYYGSECPHCAIVDKYLQENNLDSFLNIEKREVYHNSENALLLQKAANSCGIKTEEIGIPLIYSKGKCYVGEVDAVDFIKSNTMGGNQ